MKLFKCFPFYNKDTEKKKHNKQYRLILMSNNLFFTCSLFVFVLPQKWSCCIRFWKECQCSGTNFVFGSSNKCKLVCFSQIILKGWYKTDFWRNFLEIFHINRDFSSWKRLYRVSQGILWNFWLFSKKSLKMFLNSHLRRIFVLKTSFLASLCYILFWILVWEVFLYYKFLWKAVFYSKLN